MFFAYYLEITHIWEWDFCGLKYVLVMIAQITAVQYIPGIRNIIYILMSERRRIVVWWFFGTMFEFIEVNVLTISDLVTSTVIHVP